MVVFEVSLATDLTDETLGASGLWIGTRTGAGGTAKLTESFFWPQPMASWTTGPGPPLPMFISTLHFKLIIAWLLLNLQFHCLT